MRTDTPLSPGVYVKLASLVEGINMLFDQIPEVEALDAEYRERAR
jgi:hypothetical protein